jgi:HNH endonuclease
MKTITAQMKAVSTPKYPKPAHSAYKPLQEVIGLRGRGKYPEGVRRPCELTQERLRALLQYDGDTGVFTWRVRTSNRVKIGAVAGTLGTGGYVRIEVGGVPYLAHRLAWLYVHGRWPYDKLDHIDGNPSNNRLCNLRECTQAQNQQNRRTNRAKKSGLPLGVKASKTRGRYEAQIRQGGKRYWLGIFDTPELAHAAYLVAKAELHQFNPKPRPS